MNNKLIEEAFKRTRAAVEEAKTKGKKLLLFGKVYCSWSDIQLDDDEKKELKRRFADEGWKLQNEDVNGDADWKWEKKVVLRF